MKRTRIIVRPSRGYPAYKPTVSIISVCDCGMRYIKTRKNQEVCIKCFVRAEDEELS
jgi:hypothetical protein